MVKQKIYFDIEIDSLRILADWAADCADRALPIFEEFIQGDSRPRDAINGIRGFANGEKRSKKLRVLSLDAFRAAHETNEPAASAAAQAASLAAASAYTHPLVDVQQTKHILGPAAYAALAFELRNDSDPNLCENEIQYSIENAQKEIFEILNCMPSRCLGKTRIEKIMYDLDIKLRKKFSK